DSLRIIESGGRQRIGVDDKGVSPLHSLINARQEMFDNVYWHHTNRACMAMLLRAVQEAVIAGMPVADLTLHDDASLLAALARPEMPEPSRRLVAGLTERRLHKRAVEISARSGQLYHWLDTLFDDPMARREQEDRMADALRKETGLAVRPGDILIDIPKPERWRTDVWVAFRDPPVGYSSIMSWLEVAGVSDENLKRYEAHRRLIRVVAVEALRDAVRTRWDRLLLPLMSGSRP
ncbi:MAG: HD domain-containing protein, partial [Vicinamibacterales bacterium]